MFFDSHPYQLASGSNTRLVKQLLNNCFDRTLGNLQIPRDLFVGQTVENARKNVLLPTGKSPGAGSLDVVAIRDQRLNGFIVKPHPTQRNFPNRGDQLCWIAMLEE